MYLNERCASEDILKQWGVGTAPIEECFERAYVVGPVGGGGELRVSDEALKAVVYVGGLTAREPTAENFIISGTGFLVLHDLNPTTAQAPFYLITAKHVVQALGGLPVAVQINDIHGGSGIVPVPKEFPWFCHTDSSVDVAVFPWVPKPELDLYGGKIFRTSLFVTPEFVASSHLGIGDEVFSVGLFSPFDKDGPNVPLVRVGHIAMMAGKPIPTADFGPMVAHLIDGHSLDGLSGAPVFARETNSCCLNPNEVKQGARPQFLAGPGEQRLLGLMHGQWEIPPTKQGKGIDPTKILHSAISAVVPSTKILEVLDYPMVRKQREKVKGKLKPTSSQPMQKTRAGIDIPIPTREQFERDLKKAMRKQKP